jgi:transcriptional regulator with XRE-family HTH domain
MTMAQDRDGQSGLALFAAELAAVRTARGLSQDQLGSKMNYSGSLVAMIEGMRRAPTLDFARRADEVLGTPGTFERLQQHARKTPLPSWFRPWADIEAVATQLRLFEHAIVPGLLQTEDYARGIFLARPDATDDEINEMVAAKLERQAVLERQPRLWVVLDEAVLHRQAGTGKVMRDQLTRLAEMSERPNINVEVVPYSAGAHYGVSGAFAIADLDQTSRAAYLETIAEGYIIENPSAVAGIALIFDTIRAETLSRSASRDLIMKEADRWT